MISVAGLWGFLLGLLITLCLITFQVGDAFGQKMTFPGKEWEEATPESHVRSAHTPLFSPPGSRYAYWDSAMNQFANVLSHIAEESIEELFKKRIADPIGMNADNWNWGDFGEIDGIMVNGGSGNNSKHMKPGRKAGNQDNP